MVSIDDLITEMKTTVKTEEVRGLRAAKICLEFLEHAKGLAERAAAAGEIGTAPSSTRELIDMFVPRVTSTRA